MTSRSLMTDLEIIPQEILDRDYGCGDPTPYVRAGDTVLDLGSGGGKVCYILSQLTTQEYRERIAHVHRDASKRG